MDTELDRLLVAWSTAAARGGEAQVFEDLGLRISWHGDPGLQFLLSELDCGDSARVRGAMVGLFDPDAVVPGRLEKLRELMRSDDPEVAADAILNLAALDDEESVSDALRMMAHDAGRVRGACVELIARLDPPTALPLLRVCAADASPIVRHAVATAAGEQGIDELRPELEAMLDDPHPDVCSAARAALGELAND